MRKEIKKAFNLGTIEHLSGFDKTGNQVWLSQEFDLFVVEGNGRKGFKTFDGAFNFFNKNTKGMEIEVTLQDFDVVDIDYFISMMH